MIDPYISPKSDLDVASVSDVSLRKIAATVVLCSIVIEITSWFLVPKLNAFFAELLRFTGIEYWTLRLLFDLINSLMVYCIIIPLATFYSGIRWYVISFTCALIGFTVFYIELGGFKCLGNCGLPFWYDASGFVKHFVFGLVSGLLAKKLTSSYRGSGRPYAPTN